VLTRLRQRGLREGVRFSGRVARVALRHPGEALDHIRTQFALSDARERATLEGDPDWRRTIHEAMDAPWPCGARTEFQELWQSLLAEEGVVEVGRSYDADPTLAEVVWCAVRHLRPATVVETGVSRGVTSRVILEALAAAGSGQLVSVDLPPLEQPWRSLVGTAVPERLRDQWTYVRGTSARRLPAVCRWVETVDVFVHDSLHTPENLERELRTVWPSLRPGAVVVIDDAEECNAGTVVAEVAGVTPTIVRQELKSAAVAFARKPVDLRT
jgi:hypothetical protein